MKKYYVIFKTEFINNIQYLGNILTGFIGYLIILYILLNLWKYMYSNPNEIINGYTINQMIWYTIVTESLWSIISGRRLVNKIVEDVKGGNIAYNINKPYSYIGYILSTHLGGAFLRFIIFIILGILTGFIFLHEFPKLTLINCIITIISMILAIVVSSLIIIAIGLLSFIIEDSSPIYWVYSKLILVIGTIFPIEYYPILMQKILKYSPIYVVCYGPAKLLASFNSCNVLSILISQIIYICVSYLLCIILYEKGVKKLNVNGG